MGFVESYFQNPQYTQLMQVIIAFALGVIFSPFSYGFLFFLLYLVVYELAYLFFTRGCCPYWGFLFRGAVIGASILGWLLGRIVLGWRNPFRSDPNAP